MGNVQFRGICGAVRRAINSGNLVGELFPDRVRGFLPDGKKDAPDSVINNSLRHLTNLREIEEKDGVFMTKERPATSPPKKAVIVIGYLLGMKVVDGKSIITLEAESMEDH